MRMKIYLLGLLLCCATLSFAQDKWFSKYADMDDVTTVYISKKMFQMMPTMEYIGLQLANMQGKIDGLQILSTERKDLQAQMRKEFNGMIGKEYEELMRVKDKKTKANFYIRQRGELIKELIMLADTEENFSVIQLKGNFTLQDIQEITNESSR